ncbi:hypothetical protein N7454_007561 [Penicillium verhagenii]|nr:hypothetical protein N7454_007561 [Penicillium verhagenii]
MFGPKILPVILGHEAVGLIEELGPGSEAYGLEVGQLVGAPPYTGMCLECYNCKHFGPDFCAVKKVKGISAPGYFSEYSLIDAASAVIVPGEASQAEDVRRISPIFCAGVTVWDALERAQIKPGQTLAIFGLGGLGKLCATYAQALGAKVIALDIKDAQLDEVSNIAHGVINTSDLNPNQVATKLRESNKGRGAEVAIVTTGSSVAYQMALSLLEPEGRIVVVGLPNDPLLIPAGQLSAHCINIVGARIPGQAGSQRCLDFSLRQGILPSVNKREFKLEDLDEMISLMREGKVAEGRMVVRF